MASESKIVPLTADLDPTPTRERSPVWAHMPFDWGNIIITNSADDAYGLLPKTGFIHGRPRPVENIYPEREPNVNIWLIAPNEPPISGFDVEPGQADRFITTNFRGENIDVFTGFTVSAQDLAGIYAQHMMSKPGIDEATLRQSLKMLTGISKTEDAFKSLAGQNMLHHLANGMLNPLTKDLETDYQVKSHARNKNRLRRKYGGLAVTGSAALVAFDGPIEPIPAAVAITGYTAVTFLCAEMRIRKMPRPQNNEETPSEKATEYARKIVEDFHRSFCGDAIAERCEEVTL